MRNDKPKQPRLTLCRGDILAAALIFLAAVALLIFYAAGTGGKAATVQVWQDGTLLGTGTFTFYRLDRKIEL